MQERCHQCCALKLTCRLCELASRSAFECLSLVAMVTHTFSRLRLAPGAIGAGGAANVRIFPSPGLSGGSVNSWRIFFSLPLEPPGGSILGSVVFFLIFFLATVSFFLATVSRNERALVTLTQLIGRSTDQDSPTIRRRGATVKQPLVHRYRFYLRKTRFDEASVKFWLCVGDRWGRRKVCTKN